MQPYIGQQQWSVRPHVYISPWVYNRVEEEDNNDSTITAMQVSTCLSPWVYNRIEEERPHAFHLECIIG